MESKGRLPRRQFLVLLVVILVSAYTILNIASNKKFYETKTNKKLKVQTTNSLQQVLDDIDKDAMLYFAESQLEAGYRVGDYPGWRDFSFRVRTYTRLFWMYDKVLSKDDADFAKFGSSHVEQLTNKSVNKEEAVQYVRDRMLWRLEKQLFPWSHVRFKSITEMWRAQKESPMERGIIICVYDREIRQAVNLIQNIKEVLNSSLPIVVAHSGDELNKDAIRMLTQKFGVMIMDLNYFVDTNILGGIRGFQIKQFAMLVAPFVETMLVDADATFLQPPEVLFNDHGYQAEGALFFTDRTGRVGTYPPDPDWVDDNVPQPLDERIKRLRWYRRLSSYEVESGVVLINKAKRLGGSLASCVLMAKHEREMIFRLGYGDKEAWWQGFAMAGEPFHIRPDPPGCIGIQRGLDVCNCHILHFDENRIPLWFNGGVTRDKKNIDAEPQRATHYGFEGKWDWSQDDCIKEGEVFEMGEDQQLVLSLSYKALQSNQDPVARFLQEEADGVSWPQSPHSLPSSYRFDENAFLKFLIGLSQ